MCHPFVSRLSSLVTQPPSTLRSSQAKNYCECEGCNYYIISDDCPTPAPIPADDTPFSTTIFIAGLVGATFFGAIAISILRNFCYSGSSKSKNAVQPILSNVGIDQGSIHDKKYEDGVRAPEYTKKQEKTMRVIAEKMTPTKNLTGVKKLKRVVREKLIHLQDQEKKALIDKLAKAAEQFEIEMQKQEKEELDAINKGNHDPVEHAKLVLLRRQDIAYLKLRSIENGRLQREQEFRRQLASRREKIADLMEWFLEKKTGIDQTVITDQLAQMNEVNKKSIELLNSRLKDQIQEEITEMRSHHEKNWDTTPQEELVEMKKLDLKYQQIVKEDLDENDAVRREMLSRNLAAFKRVKLAEIKLKQAPPNEAEAITENLARYEKVAKDSLERELASTRRKLTTFEEILCSQRGVADDEESLRSLFKREITAVKDKLMAQKKRELEMLVRDTNNQIYLAKRENSDLKDANEEELREELNHISEHLTHMQTNMEADYVKQIDGAETAERARQAGCLANHDLVWEELAVVKMKHDGDMSELKENLRGIKNEARSSLAEQSRKQQQQLQASLSELGTPKAKGPSKVELMTPGTKIARQSSIQSSIFEHDNEQDRLYFSLEMVHQADYDRAIAAEKIRQETCEGLEDDFELRLTRLKETHEKELGLLSDSLFAEQRRQRDRLKNRLALRKKKRKVSKTKQHVTPTQSTHNLSLHP